MKLLLAFDWPGNVRQLETVLLRALVQSSPGQELSESALRGALPSPEESSLFTREFVSGRDLNRMRDELETVYLKQLFAEKQGDVAAMATDLGVTQPTLYRWFKKLGIDVRALRREAWS